MSRRASRLALVLLALSAAPAGAQFTGDLAFDPESCKAKRECVLKHDLIFIDQALERWQANAGDLTDGASIPDWAQSIIGGPWDESYLKAAIIHDHYCNNHVRSWRETHLMFYNALIDLGVNPYKAKLMYYAVYLGGPRWIDVLSEAKDKTLEVARTVTRAAAYDAMDMNREMKAADDYMKIKPDATLGDLEKMAQERHPDDMFYKFGGGIMNDVAEKRGVR